MSYIINVEGKQQTFSSKSKAKDYVEEHLKQTWKMPESAKLRQFRLVRKYGLNTYYPAFSTGPMGYDYKKPKSEKEGQQFVEEFKKDLRTLSFDSVYETYANIKYPVLGKYMNALGEERAKLMAEEIKRNKTISKEYLSRFKRLVKKNKWNVEI